jgi:hypothetical protein
MCITLLLFSVVNRGFGSGGQYEPCQQEESEDNSVLKFLFAIAILCY